MVTKIYVNLAVKDMNRAKEFYTSLGFTINQSFTDESATCMAVSENMYIMLITEKRFSDFTQKEIADSHRYAESIISIDQESRSKVDEMVRKAITAGGFSYNEAEDFGWKYQHGFTDPDGHQWEVLFMNEEALHQELQISGKI